MKYFFTLAFLISRLIVAGQQNQVNIVPAPAYLQTNYSPFSWNNETIIFSDTANSYAYDFLTNYLQEFYQLNPKVILVKSMINTIPTKTNCIILRNKIIKNNSSAYTLNISKDKIIIEGSPQAVFYGIQTLLQLLPPVKPENVKQEINNQLQQGSKQVYFSIPGLAIADSSRFAYRGMHLDVGRHFFSVDYIKKYINFLAYHKFNNFHWHLTDDQGWRIEIKKYPLLTELGSCRNQTLSGRYGSDTYDGKKYCGFYTQQQIREIVDYAAKRFINIIPEIEMPGHSKAALASYPYLGCTKGPYEVMQTWGVSNEVLCAGNDSTYTFMENVLEEVMELFPSSYIHIGGDECPKERWQGCKICQKKIKEKSLKDEHELQSYFIQRIEKFVNSKGKKIIGWDEILEGGLAPNAAVMSWRGEAGGIAAAKQNHFVIMTPETPLYLNHLQSKNEDSITQGGYNPIEAVYAYDPIPKELNEEQSRYILGAQGNMWSEYLNNEKKLEYMLFPRISALSEVLWSPKEKRNWESFEQRLPGIMERYYLWGANYSNAWYDLQPSVSKSDSNFIVWKLATRNTTGKIIYVTDSLSNSSYRYTTPLPIRKTGKYGGALTDQNDKLISNWVWQQFYINKATAKNISLSSAPNKSYSFGGAFTLVDGIQNNSGMIKSAQFLGYNGRDLEATIDLGEIEKINSIILHAFEQQGSWIYKPAEVSFYTSPDGKNFTLLETITSPLGKKNLLYNCVSNAKARFIRINAKNYGVIPNGQPGAGNKAWLFADEIEIH